MKYVIDKKSSVPAYLQLYRQMRDDIVGGVYSCGAKLPFIALMAGAVFGGAWWVAPVAYFLGMLASVASGIMLKKTKPFAGEPSPFVMELPAYHLPTPVMCFAPCGSAVGPLSRRRVP